MPRRQILTDSERDHILAIPQDSDNMVRLYSFSEAEILRPYSNTVVQPIG